MCSMYENAWTLTNRARNDQYTLAGSPVRILLVCQLNCGLSFNINLQTQGPVSLEFDFLLLCKTYIIDYAPIYPEGSSASWPARPEAEGVFMVLLYSH